MGLLAKVRGLWRFDGDTEPIAVSRRTFIFLGGVAAVGAAIPAIVAPGDLCTGPTAKRLILEGEAALEKGLFVVTDVDRLRGIITYDYLPVLAVDNPALDPRRIGELRPGDGVTRPELLRLMAVDAVHYPAGERWVVQTAGWRTPDYDEREVRWRQRAERNDRRGGLIRG